MRCGKTSRGFSLPELLVTVAMIAVMASCAVLVLKNTLQYYKLRSAVSGVNGALQSARYQAISAGCPYKVVFTSSSKSYQTSYEKVIDKDGSGNQVPPTCDTTFTNVGGAVTIADGSSVTLGADATVLFNPSGTVTTTGTVPLALTSNGRTATISVSTYGGTVTTYSD